MRGVSLRPAVLTLLCALVLVCAAPTTAHAAGGAAAATVIGGSNHASCEDTVGDTEDATPAGDVEDADDLPPDLDRPFPTDPRPTADGGWLDGGTGEDGDTAVGISAADADTRGCGEPEGTPFLVVVAIVGILLGIFYTIKEFRPRGTRPAGGGRPSDAPSDVRPPPGGPRGAG